MMMNRAVDWYGILGFYGLLYVSIFSFFNFQGQLQNGVYGEKGYHHENHQQQAKKTNISFIVETYKNFCPEKETRNLAMLLSFLSLTPETGGSFMFFSTTSFEQQKTQEILTFKEVMLMLNNPLFLDQSTAKSRKVMIRKRLALEILFLKSLISKQTGITFSKIPLLFYDQNTDKLFFNRISVLKPFIHSLHGYTSQGIKIHPEVLRAYLLFVNETE